jgi:Acetyltransferase (GNAT) domain
MAGTRTATLLAIGAAARPAWQRICDREPDLALSQTPAWSDCLCQDGRFTDVSRLYELPGGRHVVLPLVRRSHLPSPLAAEDGWPSGWGYGGLIAEGGPRAPEAAAVVEHLRGWSAGRTGLWTAPAPAPTSAHQDGWAAARPRRTRPAHVLDLAGGFDYVWASRFTSKVRSASRKAGRRGVTAEFGTSRRLLETFDALYRRSVDRWARDRHEPVAIRRWLAGRREPLHKLTTMAHRLGDAFSVGIAWRDGVPVSGIVVLVNGQWASYWRGAMDYERAAHTGANELLHRTAIERATALGCRWYDFGQSPPGGVGAFKATFGAQEWPQRLYRFERIPVTAASDRARTVARRSVVVAVAAVRPH